MTRRPAHSLPPRKAPGFSLIELLAVAAIMAIVVAMIATSFGNFARGVDLTNSSQHLNDTLNLARQIATSRGEYTQVRFLTPADTSDPRHGHFSALAVYRAESPFYTNDYSGLFAQRRMRQEGQIVTLPQSCAILNDAVFSPLVTGLAKDASRTGSSQIGGKNYDWVSFYYKPDGSTDIPRYVPATSTPLASVVTLSGIQTFKARNSLPPNFISLSLDRVDGRLMMVRP